MSYDYYKDETEISLCLVWFSSKSAENLGLVPFEGILEVKLAFIFFGDFSLGSVSRDDIRYYRGHIEI